MVAQRNAGAALNSQTTHSAHDDNHSQPAAPGANPPKPPLEDEESLDNVEVLKCYRDASKAANAALCSLMQQCVPNALVLRLCENGDRLMLKFLDQAESPKGISFPTSISINNCICHFSPINGDPASAAIQLKKGDVVKIEMGAHVKWYPSLVAFSLVVGATPEEPVVGKTADVLAAAYFAAHAAVNAIKVGGENFQVTEVVQTTVSKFQQNLVQDMLSYQIKRKILDGPKQIIINPSAVQRSAISSHHFGPSEVYAIDILVTSGAGVARPGKVRTTIFKQRNKNRDLKMRTSRVVFTELSRKFDRMAFSLRNFDDEKKARSGMVECVKNGLVMPYDVYYDTEGSIVSQFLFTVALLPNGETHRLTMGPPDFDAGKHWKTSTALSELGLSEIESSKYDDRAVIEVSKKAMHDAGPPPIALRSLIAGSDSGRDKNASSTGKGKKGQKPPSSTEAVRENFRLDPERLAQDVMGLSRGPQKPKSGGRRSKRN